MLIYIILLVVGILFSFLAHELSHLVVAKWVGADITAFKPWPHKYQDRWYFGRVSCDGLGEKRVLFYDAPLIKTVMFSVLWLVLGIFVWTPLVILALPELVDGLMWVKGYIWGPAHLDGARARTYAAVSPGD